MERKASMPSTTKATVDPIDTRTSFSHEAPEVLFRRLEDSFVDNVNGPTTSSTEMIRPKAGILFNFASAPPSLLTEEAPPLLRAVSFVCPVRDYVLFPLPRRQAKGSKRVSYVQDVGFPAELMIPLALDLETRKFCLNVIIAQTKLLLTDINSLNPTMLCIAADESFPLETYKS